MITILERKTSLKMSAQEMQCLYQALQFYKHNSPVFHSDLGQGGTVADFVEQALEIIGEQL